MPKRVPMWRSSSAVQWPASVLCTRRFLMIREPFGNANVAARSAMTSSRWTSAKAVAAMKTGSLRAIADADVALERFGKQLVSVQVPAGPAAAALAARSGPSCSRARMTSVPPGSARGSNNAAAHRAARIDRRLQATPHRKARPSPYSAAPGMPRLVPLVSKARTAVAGSNVVRIASANAGRRDRRDRFPRCGGRAIAEPRTVTRIRLVMAKLMGEDPQREVVERGVARETHRVRATQQ